MMKLHKKFVFSTIFVASSCLTPGFCQESTDNQEVTGGNSLTAGVGFVSLREPTRGSIGAGIGLFPDYEGADNYSASALPLLDISKPGTFFIKGASVNINDGLASAGLTIFHISYSEGSTRRMQILLGPLVRAYGGRNENLSDSLKGLGDIDQSIGIGGFMEINVGPWLANVKASSQDVGNDNDGVLVTLDAEYRKSVSNRLAISTGLSTSWADDDYMHGYFGITEAQAASSGYTYFDSNAGFKDIGLQFKAHYALSPHWSFEGQLGYWRLINDAADSPIVKDEGSADQVRGLAGITFQF